MQLTVVVESTINVVIQGISPTDLLHDIDLYKKKHRNGGGRQALVVADMNSPLRSLVATAGATDCCYS